MMKSMRTSLKMASEKMKKRMMTVETLMLMNFLISLTIKTRGSNRLLLHLQLQPRVSSRRLERMEPLRLATMMANLRKKKMMLGEMTGV